MRVYLLSWIFGVCDATVFAGADRAQVLSYHTVLTKTCRLHVRVALYVVCRISRHIDINRMFRLFSSSFFFPFVCLCVYEALYTYENMHSCSEPIDICSLQCCQYPTPELRQRAQSHCREISFHLVVALFVMPIVVQCQLLGPSATGAGTLFVQVQLVHEDC